MLRGSNSRAKLQSKDELTNYLTGLLGDWTVPKTISREYLRQLSAENPIEKQDTREQACDANLWHRLGTDPFPRQQGRIWLRGRRDASPSAVTASSMGLDFSGTAMLCSLRSNRTSTRHLA